MRPGYDSDNIHIKVKHFSLEVIDIGIIDTFMMQIADISIYVLHFLLKQPLSL